MYILFSVSGRGYEYPLEDATMKVCLSVGVANLTGLMDYQRGVDQGSNESLEVA